MVRIHAQIGRAAIAISVTAAHYRMSNTVGPSIRIRRRPDASSQRKLFRNRSQLDGKRLIGDKTRGGACISIVVNHCNVKRKRRISATVCRWCNGILRVTTDIGGRNTKAATCRRNNCTIRVKHCPAIRNPFYRQGSNGLNTSVQQIAARIGNRESCKKLDLFGIFRAVSRASNNQLVSRSDRFDMQVQIYTILLYCRGK